jgi:hypothetical protein
MATDQRTSFARYSEKTQNTIYKLVDRFEPHARYDSPDPVEITLDELRALLLTLKRANQLLVQADELLVEYETEARFHCVDCGEHKDGEYYMVTDELWAASGIAPHGGMLCLLCLERRIGRPLAGEDFTAKWPSKAAWDRHLAARKVSTESGRQK